MKPILPPSWSIPALAVALVATAVPGARAQWVARTFTLQPGWNAVHLDVHPEPAECDALFAGLPVVSAWDFNPTVDAPQFVQDPSALVPGSPGWLAWFPPGSPLGAADAGTLHVLRDGRPYLIKVSGSAAVNWTVVGRPSLREITWRPGAMNFVGFRVGAPAPTFQALFEGEPGLEGQPVFALTPAGSWQAVGELAATRPEPGRAYWVRCASPAQRAATLEVDAGSRAGVEFPAGVSESRFHVRNASPGARDVRLRLLASAPVPAGQPPSAGQVPLEVWKSDGAASDLGWTPFPQELAFAGLPPGAEWSIRLGVRRPGGAVAAGARYQGLLEVTDDLGGRWLVPVGAEAGAAVGPQRRMATAAKAGLWVGEAVVDAVSQPARPSGPSVPRAAGGSFSFRLIVHVDDRGVARLLQEAHVVRRPPTYRADPDNPGFQIIDEPARVAVVTREALVPAIVGGDRTVGRRISSAAFAFTAPLAFSGGPFAEGELDVVVPLPHDDARNPFLHRFHPDHDNLDESFAAALPEGREAFAVSRAVTLAFAAEDPAGENPPAWGDTLTGGVYREVITGLHRAPLHLAGTFRLSLAAAVPTLDE